MPLCLTDRQRTALLALLEDGARLRAEFPAVAGYLDTAPLLRGTESIEHDAAFDLSFAYILTQYDGPNPYWTLIEDSVSAGEEGRVIDGGSLNGSPRLGFAATILQDVYAHAVPSPSTIEWIGSVAQGRSIIDIGAGRGYWVAQLARAGLDVHAYDIEIPDKVWHVVQPVPEIPWIQAEEQVLMLCWPPGWADPMASTVLERFTEAGGRRLIYIGEPQGGKTGDDAFFHALKNGWKRQSVDSQYVRWWNLNDQAGYWERG